MHGGSAPPLVVPTGDVAHVEVHPSFAGFEVQLDGHTSPLPDPGYGISLDTQTATLVGFGDRKLGIPGLRRRGLIADSPRVVARDRR